MIKKYATYLALLLAGLIVGYLLFGTGSGIDTHANSTDVEEATHWTCSMHPRINKTEKGECPMCGMALIPIDASQGSLGPNQFQMSKNAMALANIETTTIGVGSMTDNSLLLSGVITSNEKTDAVQTTIFDGRIEKLNINYVGQYVKKGQQIGVIYAPEMYAAQDKMLTSSSYQDTHEKLWAAARNTLSLWRMTDEQVEEVIRTGKPMANFPLIADVSGTVTEVVASEGKFYKQGDPLYKVSNLYTVWAVFDAYEGQLPFLNIGQDIMIASKAFEGRQLEAKVSFIEPIFDTSKRTVSVRVTLNNGEQLLKPGMFVEGTVKVKGAGQILTVPKSAVLWTGKRSLVYLKTDLNKPIFEMAEVTLGNVIGNSYVVIDGLAPGDEVVVNGTFTVDAAAQLQGKRSMMNRMHEGGNNVQAIDDASSGLKFDGRFQKHFSKIIDNYIALKDALVATDVEKSTSKARVLLEELNRLEIGMLNDISSSHVEKIKESAKGIVETDDIEEQRKYFKPMSEHMVAVASTFSNLDRPIYVQFCPMADGNKGANWLSFEDKVRNPYFGDKMLTCGSLTKTIH
ncbi:efflux RND transporter periplasmic adaptor subunit [Maribacter algicola]|uniref:Efflux RND transporter periplasmic adaptor subunit n=1 Tax=Meishania litoralis TaxID=3434685 RepID=A0ACC7LM01_9FLAO